MKLLSTHKSKFGIRFNQECNYLLRLILKNGTDIQVKFFKRMILIISVDRNGTENYYKMNQF